MYSSQDSIFWLYSSLPQVLGALVGLVIAAIAFTYPHLDSIAEKDDSLSSFVQDVKDNIQCRSIVFFISAIVSIIIDLIFVRFPHLALCSIALEIAVALINFVTLLLLLWLLYKLISSNSIEKQIAKEFKKLESEPYDGNSIPYLEYYNGPQ